jgi:hypothetical protein
LVLKYWKAVNGIFLNTPKVIFIEPSWVSASRWCNLGERKREKFMGFTIGSRFLFASWDCSLRGASCARLGLIELGYGSDRVEKKGAVWLGPVAPLKDYYNNVTL